MDPAALIRFLPSKTHIESLQNQSAAKEQEKAGEKMQRLTSGGI